MRIGFTATQKQRLVELDAPGEMREIDFSDAAERDTCFRKMERELAAKNRRRLERLRTQTRRPALRQCESLLVHRLNHAGFVEVITPTLLSKGMLAKMGISVGHPLLQQVYWVDQNACLRPMLAPHLYCLLGHLGKLWPLPIRMFEVGPCFRKESKGSKHLSEFTMLNIVEMGIDGDPQTRLEGLARLVMGTVGLEYRLLVEKSEVYGTTTDILVSGVEIASGATGPHPLDVNWDIAENWAGLGVGLERIVMLKEGFHNIRRVGRSLIYVDGARVNIR